MFVVVIFRPKYYQNKMIYSRLTKEQLEELHPEFTRFLASQSIDKNEWEALKINKPEIAEQEIDVFSDYIWDEVLSKATFAENVSENALFLFEFLTNEMKAIIIKTTNQTVDFQTAEGIQWIFKNIHSDEIELTQGTKKYTQNRNVEIFNLIQQGAVLSKGKMYKHILNSIF